MTGHYASEDDAIQAARRNDPDFDADALPCISPVFDAEDFRLLAQVFGEMPELDNPFSDD